MNLNNAKSVMMKTQIVLKNYSDFQLVLEDKKKYLRLLKKSIFPSSDRRIKTLLEEIDWLEWTLNRIRKALEFIQNDAHYQVIEEYYFYGKSLEDIAKEYHVHVSTISKWRTRLIYKMAIYLFPKDLLDEDVLCNKLLC